MSEYKAHRCDFCPGTVQPTPAQSESVRVGDKVVLVEGVVIGKCDRCGHRYWPAEVLKRIEAVAADPSQATRMDSVPVIAA